MRKTVIALVALGLVVASSAFAANAIRISQIYGGGGSGTGSSPVYKYDYVELFNSSGTAVNIGGWAIQYGSATGSTFGSSTYNSANIPTGATIPACGYYLIQCGSAGSGADLPVTPDLITVVPNISGTTGKLALFNDQIAGRTCPQAQSVAIDLVGFNTANCYEFAVGPALTAASALLRKLGGMTDTDHNNTDFTNVTTFAPRNTHSATNPECTVVPAVSETWGRIKTIYR
jgi:uncharacterized protein